MFLHSIDRKVRLGGEDIVVDLADPGDILPLAAYIHETQGGIDYPAFYCTNIKHDTTTGDVIGCDVAVKVDGKGAAAGQMARLCISLLRQAGADFAILIAAHNLNPASSIKVERVASPFEPAGGWFYIIIPSEALPGMPRDKDRFARVIETIEKHFKEALPRSESISVLPMGEYIPLFYSINETTRNANIPVRVDKLDAEATVVP